MYFPRRGETLELESGRRLLGLRYSLNAPVVQTQELAVGPARAGIVVHEERDGRPNVTIVLRSERSSDTCFYSYEGDLREDSSLAVGIDAALSFAESMGFLFDDDELAEATPEERERVGAGFAHWLEGGEQARSASRLPASSRASSAPADAEPDSDDTMLLEDRIDEAPQPVPPRAPGSSPLPPRAVARPPSRDASISQPRPSPQQEAGEAGEAGAEADPRMLSKFRRGGAPARPEAEDAAKPQAPPRRGRGGSPLGRVRLVKRRADGSPAPDERQTFLFRLLALF